nr:PepSY-associated TM helix domain-containing protein [Lysobacter pythonis]
MAWLHTWTGLLAGWLLLLIFMAGTASYYREEINHWMRPELAGMAGMPRVAPETATTRGIAYLQRYAARAENWSITLPDERNVTMHLRWRKPADEADPSKGRRGRFGEAVIDPASGAPVGVRDTRGGEFFYRLHFDLHYLPVSWARYLVGFCAMFMLVAIISGIITHKKIFKDFFTFRPGKGQRSWLDFHNVSAVMALPYHLMITYTGIVTLMVMYFPWSVKTAYPQDEGVFIAETFAQLPAPGDIDGPPSTSTPIAPIASIIADARRVWRGGIPSRVVIHAPGRADSLIDLQRAGERGIRAERSTLRYRANDGTRVAESPPTGGATQTRDVLVGLHAARFAEAGLRALFFLSGLAGCLMVASGSVLWAIKERQKHQKRERPGFGLRLVDALNIGTVAGLPIAFAVYFWANRLLPTDMADRPEAEIRAFFIAWGVAMLIAFARPRRATWVAQLYAGAALFALLPVLNALATPHAHLIASLRRGDLAMAGFDLVVLLLGLGLALSAHRTRQWKPAQRPPRPGALAANGATG